MKVLATTCAIVILGSSTPAHPRTDCLADSLPAFSKVTLAQSGPGGWAERFWAQNTKHAVEQTYAAIKPGSELAISERFFLDTTPWIYPEDGDSCGDDEDCAMTPYQIVHMRAASAGSPLSLVTIRSLGAVEVTRISGVDTLRTRGPALAPIVEGLVTFMGRRMWFSAQTNPQTRSTTQRRKELVQQLSDAFLKCK